MINRERSEKNVETGQDLGLQQPFEGSWSIGSFYNRESWSVKGEINLKNRLQFHGTNEFYAEKKTYSGPNRKTFKCISLVRNLVRGGCS